MATQTQELIHSRATGLPVGNGEHLPSIFDNFSAAMPFITEMGKAFAHSGIAGVKTVPEGMVMVFACLAKRLDPITMGERYHLIDGKASKRADRMLAEFNEAGGKHRWLASGDDGQRAALELTPPSGEPVVSEFSIGDAKEMGLCRAGSRWTKGPKAIGEMLRARCTTRGIRMVMPGIVAGCLTPEEIEDERAVEPPRPVRTAEEVARRREEIQAAASVATPVQSDLVIETEVETVATVASQEALPEAPPWTEVAKPATSSAVADLTPASKGSENNIYAVLMEIESTLKPAGITNDQLTAALKAKNPQLNQLEDLSLEQLQAVLTNVRAKAAKAKEKN